MRLSHIIHAPCLALLEAKARIEHPEDMILDGGVSGAHTALKILQVTADQPHSISVKFDGSPSLIMGWRGDEFILTDKAGFSAKGYDGMTTSAEAIDAMIMNRKMKDTSPEAVASRKAYAAGIAGLHDRLKQVVPREFQGFAQGDLMWTKTPPVVNGAYEFAPVKIKYRVPVDSGLGRQIQDSQVGMVIHSVFASPQDDEPEALRDVSNLGFKNTAGVVILPHEIMLKQPLTLDTRGVAQANKLLKNNSQDIQAFLDPMGLTDNEIKALPGIMKSFVAYKAGKGEDDFSNAPTEFIEYVQSPMSKVSAKMAPRIISWIQSHVEGYNSIWQFIQTMVGLKMDLKRQIDSEVGHHISASLRGSPGHEGFVSVTADGIVKLVNRAEFMKKDLMEATMETVSQDKPRVVFTFARANPPTPGHVKVIKSVAQHANGGDYWIFLSQSQDTKKNPLTWADKAHYLGKLTPAHKSHIAVGPEFDKIKTPLLAADWLYDQGYRDFTMVVGSDRVDSMRDILDAWNSDTIRTKYNREPVQMRVISAGDRDPDADDVSGISASKMRDWAQTGDQKQFVKNSGLPESDALELYNKVRTHMKITESQTQASEGHIVKLQLNPQSAAEIKTWCESHGVPCVDAQKLHMTILWCEKSMPQLKKLNDVPVQIQATPEHWQVLGESALVLKMHVPEAHVMHHRLLGMGCEHGYDNFIPHVSVNYKWHAQKSIPTQLPPHVITFDVIKVEPIDPNWSTNA